MTTRTVLALSSSSVRCTLRRGDKRSIRRHQGQARTACNLRTLRWMQRMATSWTCPNSFDSVYDIHIEFRRINYLEFCQSFAGEETAALRLEFDDTDGDFLIALVFQLRQDSRTEKYLWLKQKSKWSCIKVSRNENTKSSKIIMKGPKSRMYLIGGLWWNQNVNVS